MTESAGEGASLGPIYTQAGRACALQGPRLPPATPFHLLALRLPTPGSREGLTWLCDVHRCGVLELWWVQIRAFSRQHAGLAKGTCAHAHLCVLHPIPCMCTHPSFRALRGGCPHPHLGSGPGSFDALLGSRRKLAALGQAWGGIGGDLLYPSEETGGRGLSPSPRGLPQLPLASEKGETLGLTESPANSLVPEPSGAPGMREQVCHRAGAGAGGSALVGRGLTVLVDEV